MPKLSAVGSRESAFDRFETALSDTDNSDFVALLIDSEDPITDVERTWDHLRQRDGWSRPEGGTDDQVLFMTTSMETWIVADRSALEIVSISTRIDFHLWSIWKIDAKTACLLD